MAVEHPPFTTRLHDGAFEVREYPGLVAAEVTVAGDRQQAASRGFRRLAGYIFGGNSRRDSIAMTAPVTLSPADGVLAPLTVQPQGAAWVVRFTMPRRYAIGALPAPADPQVKLRAVPAVRTAVVRFSGLAQPAEVRSKEGELRGWMAAHRLRAAGPASLALYDPPWTLWFLRRNEVMIPVAR